MKYIKAGVRKGIALLCVVAMLVSGIVTSPFFSVYAEDSALKSALESAVYTAAYAQTETVEKATTVATNKVQAVIDNYVSDNGLTETPTFTIKDGAVLNRRATGGTFSFVVEVTEATGTFTSNLSMTITARPKPSVVSFDNETTVNKAYVGFVTEKTFKDDTASGGKKYMHLTSSDKNGPAYTTFYTDASEQMNFDEYPYMKISYRQSSTKWRNMQIFATNDNSAYTGNPNLQFQFYPGGTQHWTNAIVDLRLVKAQPKMLYDEENKGYIASELVKVHATENVWSGAPKTGTNLTLNLSRINSAVEQTVDVEYIAFFASKEEAEAYPGSLNPEVSPLQTSLEETTYQATYAQTETVEAATTVAKKQVQAVLDSYVAKNSFSKAPSFTIADGATLVRSVSGGTYTFKVTVTEPEYGATFTSNLSMTITAKPAPNVVIFDNETTVKNAYVGAVSEKVFVDDTNTGGKKYMHLTSSDKNGPTYTTFYTDASEQMNFDEYPYMKISYRHSSTKWRNIQIYATNDNSAYTGNPNLQLQFYPGSTQHWTNAVVDLRAVKVQKNMLYDEEDNKYIDSEFVKAHGTENTWSGAPKTGTNLTLYLSRINSAVEQTVDVEYIAFFASKEDAQAYPNVVVSYEEDLQTLKNAKFECDDTVASSQTEAHSKLESLIEALDLTNEYTLQNGVYTAPTSSAKGSYKVDVVFDAENKVTVTLEITKTTKPVIWTFDNNSTISAFTGTNANICYEDGYLKMTTQRTSYDDGFFLANSLTQDEKFELSQLPFVKIKYKISGAESAPLQFYYWLDNGNHYYRTFYGNDSDWENDMVTVIADLSVLGEGKDAVWLDNPKDSEKKTLQYSASGASAGKITCNGVVQSLRLNLARQADLDRTASVEYVGFFPSYEAAAKYEGVSQERVNKAVEYLTENSELKIQWGAGNTEELAKKNAALAVEASGVGCTLQNVAYNSANETQEGNITFDAVLKSAEASATVKNLTVTIGKKPTEPIVWRFNDSEFVNKLTFTSAVNATVENNVLKMVSTDPGSEDGFYFFVNMPEDTKQFYLEDYKYVAFKYKRDGVAPGQLYFYSDQLKGNPNLASFALGKESGDWYTSIIDTTVWDSSQTMVYSYNHDTKVMEEYARDPGYLYTKYEFHGLSTKFRFNFARRANLDRTLYLEYIAFFPTLEEAQAYKDKEEAERLISNSQLALKSYTGSEVSYYEGYTETEAKETAGEKLKALLGTEVTANINKVSYTKPVKNDLNGSYVFTADICDAEGNVLYTTDEYTLTISAVANTEPIVFTFSNPDFVDRDTLVGTNKTVVDYSYMLLADTLLTSFTLTLNKTEEVNLEGHPYLAYKVDTSATTSNLILNGEKYRLDEVDSTGNVIDLSEFSDEQVTQLGLECNGEEAKVYYMAFFATLEEAQRYTATSETLANEVAKLQATSLNCAYADAKTEEEGLMFATTKVEEVLSADSTIVSSVTRSYQAATTSELGKLQFRVLLRNGTETDSHYEYVELSMTIGKQPSQPIVLDIYNGTIYAGGNATITKENNLVYMDTKVGTQEGNFLFEALPSDVGGNFYLQDYPYVKIKYRRTGCNGTNTGDAYFYFWNDEKPSEAPYRMYSFGNGTNENIWSSALLDMTQNTITISDLENDLLVSETAMSGSLDYRGKVTKFRFDMGRHIYVPRHMEIEYIAFFSSREEAEAYQNDYVYSSYEFNGVEYATAEESLSVAPKTIEVGVKMAADTNKAMTILSNQGEGNDKWYSVVTTTEGNIKVNYAGTTILETTEVNLHDGAWHQLAVSLANNNATLYVDGIVCARNSTFTLDAEMSLQAPIMAPEFKGHIYYMRLYDDVLAEEKIKANAFCKEVEDEAVIAGWFTDSLSNEEQFADVKGKNPMTLQDNYEYEGHEFLGNDWIKTEKALASIPTEFEFWMKTTSAQAEGTYTILSNRTDASTEDTSIMLVDGQMKVVYGGSELLATTDFTFADNIWKHVHIIIGETSTLSVDDVPVVSSTVTPSTSDAAKSAYYIGADLRKEKTPYVGKLSEVKISGADSTLLSSWKLDTQTYLEYADESLNQNTGTLYSSGWYKLENITGDYSMGVIGDTQSYMLTVPSLFEETFEKLAGKIDEFKMKHLFHVGDVTQNDTLMEWRYARSAYDHLEGLIPYTIIQGNHDYPSPSSGRGSEMRDSTNFNTVFPRDKYITNTEYYGGSYDQTNSINVYNFLNVGGVEYIILALENGPRDEVLEWASNVLDQYPEKRAIVLTHIYIAYGGNDGDWDELTTNNANAYVGDFATANDGDDVWEKLLSKHDNIAMLLCGHSQNPFISYRVDESDYRTDVIQIMADHSAMVTGFPSKEGLMTIMSFTEDGKMHTYWYSPLYDAYYDTGNEVTFDMTNALYHENITGDANEDKTINVKDLVRMKRQIANQTAVSKNSDWDENGVFEALDITGLKKWIVGFKED